ncbi:MAG TPA: alkene reductase [Steroidobacteraceae bacterium]|jgi:N-ethylmaleimide reductase|nr:alkene reductase [Steroidobacteraceae bacterium]
MNHHALFTPCRVGGRELAHRIALAPMTRTRADYATLAPTAETALYYAQRASGGGLLITEATHISPEATPVWTIYSAVRDDGGHVPGIWSGSQVDAWRAVTDAVHGKGALISCQLLHAGRVAQPGIGEHPLVRGSGAPLPPVSSSASALRPDPDGGDYSWDQPAVVPRALDTGEIARVIEDYRRAASNAGAAGFDYVELHAAHGYLIEQFLCDGINRRPDRYGGSIGNRCRLLFEIVETLVAELGPGRLGVRLSPTSVDAATGKLHQTYFGAFSSDAEQLYEHAVAGLNEFPLAYLMLTEPRVGALSEPAEAAASHAKPLRNGRLRAIYRGVLIGAGGFTPRTAEAAVAGGAYDLVAFGRWFLANPDLPDRLRDGSPLNVYDRATFYGVGAKGYIDYPRSREIGNPRFGTYPLIEQSRIGSSLRAITGRS